jgi:hypothetical protein
MFPTRAEARSLSLRIGEARTVGRVFPLILRGLAAPDTVDAYRFDTHLQVIDQALNQLHRRSWHSLA